MTTRYAPALAAAALSLVGCAPEPQRAYESAVQRPLAPGEVSTIVRKVGGQ